MPDTGTIYGKWKIKIAEAGTGLQSSPPSRFEITEDDKVTDLRNVNWGAEAFTLGDYSDSAQPHLKKVTIDPVVVVDGEDCRALFGLTKIFPDEIEVVVELLDTGAQGGGSARGQR